MFRKKDFVLSGTLCGAENGSREFVGRHRHSHILARESPQPRSNRKSLNPTSIMFRKNQKQHEKQMLDIVNNRSNGNKCGECGADFPTWASWNLGILLCGRCANCHRKVLSSGGPHGGAISYVKSLTLETWSEHQIESLKRIGNKKAKNKWNPKSVPFPHDDDDDGPIEEFLREKYILGRYRDDNIDYGDYGDKNGLYSDDSGRLTPSGRSRSSTVSNTQSRRSRAGSRAIPNLTHRKSTQYEQQQYRNLMQRITRYGYSNEDAIYESLVLSDGDMNFALDILDHDARVNPSSTEAPPQLPRRPASSVSQLNTSSSVNTPPTSSGSDWWSAQTTSQQQQTQATGVQAGQPQIYQYTDPITGQVSYVDSNGQQYLDPSNPQHQQMLMQQTNPQYLMHQATKQNVMSLYNQPNNFTTDVVVPATQQTGQIQSQQPQMTGYYGSGQQVYVQPGMQQQYGQAPQQFWR